MDTYLVVKLIHILSSTVLFGTGIGIAFFMFRTRFTADRKEKYFAVRNTVLADYIFTLPAVIIQPMSGAWMVWQAGYDWTSLWLLLTYALYAIAGACWLPVVWIQIQLKNMLSVGLNDSNPLSARYYRLFKLWFMLAWPAFISLIVIFYLMIRKPL